MRDQVVKFAGNGSKGNMFLSPGGVKGGQHEQGDENRGLLVDRKQADFGETTFHEAICFYPMIDLLVIALKFLMFFGADQGLALRLAVLRQRKPECTMKDVMHEIRLAKEQAWRPSRS